MDNGVLRAAGEFIRDLTGAGAEEVKKYIGEISSNREFHKRLDENRSRYGIRRYSLWSFDIGATLGMVLYALCRRLKPDIAVETGVASGVSSAYILCALEQTGHGDLYSIDLPGSEAVTYPYSSGGGTSPEALRERQNGWIIPDYLRHRWHLVLGRSEETLSPLLEEVRQIDIFLHDSEHTYQNMLREYQTAWACLKAGGLLLSHNINMNGASTDFCRRAGVKGYVLKNMGGIVKPT